MDIANPRTVAEKLATLKPIIGNSMLSVLFFCSLKERSDFFSVINTCGPFDEKSFEVARSSVEARAHYIDLADNR